MDNPASLCTYRLLSTIHNTRDCQLINSLRLQRSNTIVLKTDLQREIPFQLDGQFLTTLCHINKILACIISHITYDIPFKDRIRCRQLHFHQSTIIPINVLSRLCPSRNVIRLNHKAFHIQCLNA